MMLLCVNLLLFNSSENVVMKLSWPEFSSTLYRVTAVCILSVQCTLMGSTAPSVGYGHDYLISPLLTFK
jgi:hypothetical protein